MCAPCGRGWVIGRTAIAGLRALGSFREITLRKSDSRAFDCRSENWLVLDRRAGPFVAEIALRNPRNRTFPITLRSGACSRAGPRPRRFESPRLEPRDWRVPQVDLPSVLVSSWRMQCPHHLPSHDPSSPDPKLIKPRRCDHNHVSRPQLARRSHSATSRARKRTFAWIFR